MLHSVHQHGAETQGIAQAMAAAFHPITLDPRHLHTTHLLGRRRIITALLQTMTLGRSRRMRRLQQRLLRLLPQTLIQCPPQLLLHLRPNTQATVWMPRRLRVHQHLSLVIPRHLLGQGMMATMGPDMMTLLTHLESCISSSA